MKKELEAAYECVADYAYPTLPQCIEASKVVLGGITGDKVDRNCLIHCGYVVQGFALSQVFPHVDDMETEGMTSRALTAHKFSKAKAQKELQKLASLPKPSEGMSATEGVGDAKAIDWMSIVMLILELIKQWKK